ncbi:MAG: hypothetical protein ACREC9_15815, partial [Methylocella sp.]
GLTPYEYICKIWTNEPDRFKVDPFQHNVGLNILAGATCGFGVAAIGVSGPDKLQFLLTGPQDCAAAAPAKTHAPAKITNAPLSCWIFARPVPDSGNFRRCDFKNAIKYDPGHKPPAPSATAVSQST